MPKTKSPKAAAKKKPAATKKVAAAKKPVVAKKKVAAKKPAASKKKVTAKKPAAKKVATRKPKVSSASAYAGLTAAAKAVRGAAAAGEHAEVVAALRPYIQALPDDPPARGSGDAGVASAFSLLGQALEGLGQNEVAAAAFEAAAAWSPRQAAEDALARLALGKRKTRR